MKKNKSIVVLLAAYNGEKYISSQIRSILNQSITPKKIFVSVDRSNDKTLEILKKYSSRNSKIEIISKNQRYGSSFLNFINLIKIKKIKDYDYVALSDQDDIWRKNKFKLAINQLNKNYDCYSSDVLAFWKNGKKKIIKKSHKQKSFDYFFEAGGPGCTYVMKKNFIIEFQKFLKINNAKIINLNNFHDWLIYFFARTNKYNWYFDKNISLDYRQHKSNEIGANKGFKAKLNRLEKVLNGDAFRHIEKLILLHKLEKHKFVKKWYPFSSKGFLFLLFNSRKCRRRIFDQISFSFLCLLLFFKYLVKNK